MSARIYARQIAEDGSIMGGSMRYPERFSWSSDAPGVATVDSLGVVTGVKEGTATITATSEGVTGTATVSVRDAARLAWSCPLPGAVEAGLAIGDDGTIYVSAAGTLDALDRNGQPLWSVHTGKTPPSTPAIGRDGMIYVATPQPGASLMAVDRSGAIHWTLASLGTIISSPAIGSDGTVYVASQDSTLYAVAPAGQIQWAFRARGAFQLSSPAIAQDASILVGSEDGRLYAVSPQGTERWTFQTGGPIQSSPAIAPDGTVYFGSHDGRLYALNPDGEARWAVTLGEQIWSSPAIGEDGTVYVGANGISAIDPSGRLRWTFTGSFPPTVLRATPVIAADGSIYFSGLDRRVWAIAPDGTPKWDHPTRGIIVASPAIGVDGTIFAASYDSTLYAIVERAASNASHAHAPWPKARADRANTGRAGGR
ncbi:MAG TPA: PQQ-binding-like beta-propeller repeat protein [Longimicrobiales bacterium]|nr:PQQ-binding-like beta-propeller repeat protein [Longimicrobiales bacterium]